MNHISMQGKIALAMLEVHKRGHQVVETNNDDDHDRSSLAITISCLPCSRDKGES
jgi:hypothetical protein